MFGPKTIWVNDIVNIYLNITTHKRKKCVTQIHFFIVANIN